MMLSRKRFCAFLAFAALCGGGPLRAQLEGDSIPVTTHHPVAAVQDNETQAERDERMGWWREARFGMLITWGLYAMPAGSWDGKPVDGIGEARICWGIRRGRHSSSVRLPMERR